MHPTLLSELLTLEQEAKSLHEHTEFSCWPRACTKLPTAVKMLDRDLNSNFDHTTTHDASKPLDSQFVLWCRFLRISPEIGLIYTTTVPPNTIQSSNLRARFEEVRLSQYTKLHLTNPLSFDGTLEKTAISFHPLFDLSRSLQIWSAKTDANFSESTLFTDYSARIPVEDGCVRSPVTMVNLHESNIIDHGLNMLFRQNESGNAETRGLEQKGPHIKFQKSYFRTLFTQILHITTELFTALPEYPKKSMSAIDVDHFVYGQSIEIDHSPYNCKRDTLPSIYRFSRAHKSACVAENALLSSSFYHVPIQCGKLLFLGLSNQLSMASLSDMLHLGLESLYFGGEACETRQVQFPSLSETNHKPELMNMFVLLAHTLLESVSDHDRLEFNSTIMRHISAPKRALQTLYEADDQVCFPKEMFSVKHNNILTVALFTLGLLNMGKVDDFFTRFLVDIALSGNKNKRNSRVSSQIQLSPREHAKPGPSAYTYFYLFKGFEDFYGSGGQLSGVPKSESFKKLYVAHHTSIIAAIAFGSQLCGRMPEPKRFQILSHIPWTINKHVFSDIMHCGAKGVPSGSESASTNSIPLLSPKACRKDVSFTIQEVIMIGMSCIRTNNLKVAVFLIEPFLVSDSVSGEAKKEDSYFQPFLQLTASSIFLRFFFADLIMWDTLGSGYGPQPAPLSVKNIKIWENLQENIEIACKISESLKTFMHLSDSIKNSRKSARLLAVSIKMASSCNAKLFTQITYFLIETLSQMETSSRWELEENQQRFFIALVSLSILMMGSSDASVHLIINEIERHSFPSTDNSRFNNEPHSIEKLCFLIHSSNGLKSHNCMFITPHYLNLARLFLTLESKRVHDELIVIVMVFHLLLGESSSDLSLIAPFIRLYCMGKSEKMNVY